MFQLQNFLIWSDVWNRKISKQYWKLTEWLANASQKRHNAKYKRQGNVTNRTLLNSSCNVRIFVTDWNSPDMEKICCSCVKTAFGLLAFIVGHLNEFQAMKLINNDALNACILKHVLLVSLNTLQCYEFRGTYCCLPYTAFCIL